MNIVDRITATGADDSTDFDFLLKTSGEYPLVEWGILVSKDRMGSPRFPSQIWLDEMYHEHPKAQFSCHLCGQWVRELCFEGKIDFIKVLQLNLFQRIQLNFHAIVHKLNKEKFIEALKMFPSYQFIFQLDDVNNSILDVARDAGINAVPLFDTSGGAGVLPKTWPKANGYCGYAGGLSPENLNSQMELIGQVAGDGPIWIDAETQLRSPDDKIFMEDKVKAYLEEAMKWSVPHV